MSYWNKLIPLAEITLNCLLPWACRNKRDAIQLETTEAQAFLAEETLLVPEHHIYNLRAKVRTNADSQKLRATYQALTDAERDL